MVLVRRTYAVGSMTNGIHHPNLMVPIGNDAGWNRRRAGGAEGAQCAGTGSFIPFASTEAERQAASDPRL